MSVQQCSVEFLIPRDPIPKSLSVGVLISRYPRYLKYYQNNINKTKVRHSKNYGALILTISQTGYNKHRDLRIGDVNNIPTMQFFTEVPQILSKILYSIIDRVCSGIPK